MKNLTVTMAMILAYTVHIPAHGITPEDVEDILFYFLETRLSASIPVRAADINKLLDLGADPNARTEDGESPLHLAALYEVFNSPDGKPTALTVIKAVITSLVDAGADPKARTEDGRTPWDYAKENEALKGTAVYWRLNDLRF